MKLIVLKNLRDKNTKNVYYPGQEIDHLDEERARDAISRGLCKKAVEDEAENPISDINMGDNWKAVVSAVGKVSDCEKLKYYLEKEKAREEPRASVVKALEDRIEELSEF
jgi:hypothetical protein